MTARHGGQWLGALAAVALVTGCAPETGPLLREDFERLRADLIRSQQVLQKGQTDLRTEFQQGDARSDGLIASGRQEYYTIEAEA